MFRLKTSSVSKLRLLFTAIFLFVSAAGWTMPASAASADPGAVYTLTNSPAGNEVRVYARATDGTLAFQGAYATGGLGSGAGLGSQGAAMLSQDNRWLFAVNAGSNEVSVFQVTVNGLLLADVANSGGTLPISLDVHGNLLYVLNAGGSGNITGFDVDSDGHLTQLAGSTQYLSNGGVGAAPGPAQISFSPDGGTLVVTEKATNMIDTYAVENNLAVGPYMHASSGPTPFGFGFSKTGSLIVSEAFGGQAGASALSSYAVDGSDLNVISASVHTTQTAACWIAVSKNSKFAYTTNAGSGSISSYAIAANGSITLMNATAAIIGAGSSPVDMAFSNNGSFMYALGNGSHTISAYAFQSDGSLVLVGTYAVPVGVVGLAAR